MQKHKVFQVYAELVGYTPKIWRHFKIAGDQKLVELAYGAMIMFEMQAKQPFSLTQLKKDRLNQYLHEKGFAEEIIDYQVNHSDYAMNIHYEIPMGTIKRKKNEHLVDPQNISIKSTIDWGTKGLKFILYYGKYWQVLLIFEGLEEKKVSLTNLPYILDGEGFGIVEGISGPISQKKLDDYLQKKESLAVKTTSDLDNGLFDLLDFDKENMNLRLKKLIRLYHYIYQKNTKTAEKTNQYFRDNN